MAASQAATAEHRMRVSFHKRPEFQPGGRDSPRHGPASAHDGGAHRQLRRVPAGDAGRAADAVRLIIGDYLHREWVRQVSARISTPSTTLPSVSRIPIRASRRRLG